MPLSLPPSSDAEEWILSWGFPRKLWTLALARNFYSGHNQTGYSEDKDGWMLSFILEVTMRRPFCRAGMTQQVEPQIL